MKKYLSAMLALAIILTLFAGCGGAPAAEPDPEPASEPTSDAAEAAPEPEPATLEGIVKEVSPDKLIITLADGSNVALSTSGIAGLEAEAGDTVKAEYTGAVGAMTASRVEVTAKVEKEIVTVSGVVTGLDDEFVYLTLEDGTDAALRTVSMEEGEVEEGDTLTIHYTDGGGTILSIDVTKAEKRPEVQDAAASQAAQGTGGSSSGAASSQAAQTAAKKADYTVSAVVVKLTSDLFTIDQDDGATMILDRKLFESQIGRAFQVGDKLTVGYTTSGSMGKISYIELAGFDPTVSSGSYDDDDDDYYYDYEDDYTPPSGTGDVYEAIRLINDERKKAGLKEVTIDSDLMAMAAVRAKELHEKYSHTRPDGSDWFTIFDEFESSLWPCAENAGAKSTASQQISSWMNSSGHKANILKENATKIGVGYDGNRWIMILAY